MRAAFFAALLAAAASAHAQQYGNLYQARQNAFVAQATGQAPGTFRAQAARTGVGSSVVTGSGARAKPFSGVTRAPVVSPYLNLYREEEGNAAPNYHVFVQPQLEQQQLFQTQQRQLLQLQRSLQQTGPVTAPAARIAGGARFGDTGRYYGGLRR